MKSAIEKLLVQPGAFFCWTAILDLLAHNAYKNRTARRIHEKEQIKDQALTSQNRGEIVAHTQRSVSPFSGGADLNLFDVLEVLLACADDRGKGPGLQDLPEQEKPSDKQYR